MRRTLLVWIGLLSVFLLVRADSCFLKEKEIQVPVRDTQDLTWHTTGDPGEEDTQVLNLTEVLLDLEDGNDFEPLVSAHIESARWQVKRNDGDTDLMIQGALYVTRLAKPGATGAPVQEAQLVEYGPIPISEATGVTQLVPLEPGGVTLINAGFDEYLAARKEGQDPPDIVFEFRFEVSATNDDPEPDIDFFWEALVKMSLVGVVQVDVPELY